MCFPREDLYEILVQLRAPYSFFFEQPGNAKLSKQRTIEGCLKEVCEEGRRVRTVHFMCFYVILHRELHFLMMSGQSLNILFLHINLSSSWIKSAMNFFAG